MRERRESEEKREREQGEERERARRGEEREQGEGSNSPGWVGTPELMPLGFALDDCPPLSPHGRVDAALSSHRSFLDHRVLPMSTTVLVLGQMTLSGAEQRTASVRRRDHVTDGDRHT
tara:strand:+ start:296 stop:649 length:354 start_codon:yes stop_codon:yes gene_type:complete